MKKIGKYLLVILLVFFISSCTLTGTSDPGNDTNKNKEEEALEPTEKEMLQSVVEGYTLPLEVTEKLPLKDYVEDSPFYIGITWISDNTSAMDGKGNIKRQNSDQVVNLKGIFETIKGEKVEKTFQIIVKGYTNLERLNKALLEFEVDRILSIDSKLKKLCSDKDIVVTWESSNRNIFDENGVKYLPEEKNEITLILTLSLNGETLSKTFKTIACVQEEVNYLEMQTIIDKYSDFNKGTLDNLEFNQDNCLVMTSNEASYTSPIVEVSPFTDLVGSWCAVTNANTGSTELKVRVRVNGVWSAFMSYGAWKLSAKNASCSGKTSDGLAKMDSDTVVILNSKKADAYQYLVEFKKTSTEQSPILKNITININCGFNDEAPKTTKTEVVYDVPKLYQHDVPSIGGSICSPTTTTMLLKYYGHSFKGLGYDYEHEYVARMVYDNGDNIFGNWCYCVAIMGAVGEFSYVKRFTGPNELIDYLANVGPVGLSVKGNMQGYYTTNGHLIVCKGFKVVNGNYVFICNDPNIRGVEIEYNYDTIKNTWKNVGYCIDPSQNI